LATLSLFGVDLANTMSLKVTLTSTAVFNELDPEWDLRKNWILGGRWRNYRSAAGVGAAAPNRCGKAIKRLEPPSGDDH
jgi:hypothetical protein